jgi:hypothetical protein
VRRLALWIVALTVSLVVHAMVSWRIGEELDEAVDEQTKRRLVDVLPQTSVEVDALDLLKFEQPVLEPPPEMLIPNRASVVVPDVASTALRAVRGGGPLVVGVGSRSGLPGPEGREQGTGLGEGVEQFARYVDELREAGLDVLFVVDATGSMGWALDEVKGRIGDIIEWVRDLVPIARFGVVAFRDQGDPEFVVRIQSLTYSTAKLERFLGSLAAAGGGNLGESVYAGMRAGIERGGWRPAGKRLVILIGDAPPHRDESDELLRLVSRFHADGGQVTSLDVSDEANPALLEARLGRKVNRNLYRGEPSYDFARIAERGGGDAATLDGELRLTRRLVNLIFGQRYAGELALALEAIEP